MGSWKLKNWPDLDKFCTSVPNVLEIISFTNCPVWLFFNKYAYERTFEVTWVREATWISRTCTLKQSVRQIFETSNVTCFSFHVLYASSSDFQSYYSF